MKSAIDANFVGPPIPHEYQDVHVVASVLKAYLRSLPEPLLTYKFYEDFLEAATKPSEQQRKSAILNIINQLPEGNYNNLKYLTKFLSYLSEKNQQNKMSTQNLAIVMSPNLLWPPDSKTNELDYAHQVNSTAAINTIVETLISDWGFFFEGEVNFYDSMSRDELFPDNGGFPYDKEQSVISSSVDLMSKSMNSAIGMGVGYHNVAPSVTSLAQSNNSIDLAPPGIKNNGNKKSSAMSHSRSSSHDTSLILMNEQMKASQSNSSLSDVSPTMGSPKLPLRRKKPAPVPPMTPDMTKLKSVKERDTKFAIPSPVSKLHDTANFSFIDCDDQHIDDHHHHQQHKTLKSTTNLKKAGSTDNLISKPDRPPRPVVMNAECQTLNRSFIRNIPLKSSSDMMTPPKPIALPRTSLTKSELNKSEENMVAVREKPAIPERPISLMRPHSFRSGSGGLSSPTSALANEKLVEELQATLGSSVSGLKKTNSFKSVDKSDGNGSVLERTQMYHIDKQQVEIFDVKPSPQMARKQLFSESSDNKENSHNLNIKIEKSSTSTTSGTIDNNAVASTLVGSTESNSGGSEEDVDDDKNNIQSYQVPASPRAFDAKIKRPQVPPPARPKSSELVDNSTNL